MVTAMPERTSDPQVIPYLLYADAGAAMDWLIKAFAFTERVRDKRSDGTVRHGELLLDNGGVIMVGSPGTGFRGPRELGAGPGRSARIGGHGNIPGTQEHQGPVPGRAVPVFALAAPIGDTRLNGIGL